MAAEFKAAVAFVIAVSAALQMILAMFARLPMSARAWGEDLARGRLVSYGAALRSVGLGLSRTPGVLSLLGAYSVADGCTPALSALARRHRAHQILFGSRPPSMTVVHLQQPIERDIPARRRAIGGDLEGCGSSPPRWWRKRRSQAFP
jgi:hypothetical protein